MKILVSDESEEDNEEYEVFLTIYFNLKIFKEKITNPVFTAPNQKLWVVFMRIKRGYLIFIIHNFN